jgi:hypothetical protein
MSNLKVLLLQFFKMKDINTSVEIPSFGKQVLCLSGKTCPDIYQNDITKII